MIGMRFPVSCLTAAFRRTSTMIPLLMILMVFGCIAVPQMILSVFCISRFPNLRLLSTAALVSAILQILSLLFARRILATFHVPSSFDPVADGLEIIFHAFMVTVLFVITSLLLHIVLLFRMNQTNGKTD